ncbi:MAG: hypothetical protein JWQ37_1845 [Blastococcus sp.]|nr:hypothetical protein [Blastococcus sp.]
MTFCTVGAGTPTSPEQWDGLPPFAPCFDDLSRAVEQAVVSWTGIGISRPSRRSGASRPQQTSLPGGGRTTEKKNTSGAPVVASSRERLRAATETGANIALTRPGSVTMIPSAATMAPPGPKTGIAKQHWPEGPCAGLIATPRWRVAASYFRNGAEMAGHRSPDPGTPPSARWRALPGGEKANRTRPSAVEGMGSVAPGRNPATGDESGCFSMYATSPRTITPNLVRHPVAIAMSASTGRLGARSRAGRHRRGTTSSAAGRPPGRRRRRCASARGPRPAPSPVGARWTPASRPNGRYR